MKNLFESFAIKELTLNNKIVMAPLTRSRAKLDGTPTEMMATYYQQRATAGLIIAEATQISQQGQGYIATPGIYSKEHVQGWKQVVQQVHQAGGCICLQLWHVGRISHEEFQPNHDAPVAPSAIQAKAKVYNQLGFLDVSQPRELTTNEIKGVVNDYAKAAENAKAAGFDMIEIHAANGYLIDQFLRDKTNHRSDEYGGSITNRAKFLMEIIDAVQKIYPAHKIGCRIAPVSEFNDISDSDPESLFSHVAEELGKQGLGYLHVIEGHTTGDRNNLPFNYQKLYQIFKSSGGIATMANNGYTKELAEAAQDEIDLICFGRPFISNPNLVQKLQDNIPLTPGDESTFYGGDEKGYIDY